MRTRTRLAALALGVGLLALPGAPLFSDEPPAAKPAEADKVDLVDIKYAGLGQAIKAQRGKVVVVELWNVY